MEKFEIATFNSFKENAEVVESDLNIETALKNAKALFKTGKHFGVQVISQDPNSLKPIKWIKTKNVTVVCNK